MTPGEVPLPDVIRAQDPVDAFEWLFVHKLIQQLERAPRPLCALDFACGSGFATLNLRPNLPPGTRVVAIGRDRVELSAFHSDLKDTLRPSVFIRKESSSRLPFADGAFDLAWASFATQRLSQESRPLLRQVVRTLQAPGQILIATPLRETVVELKRAISPLVSDDEPSGIRMMFDEDTTLLSATDWHAELERVGAVDVGVDREVVTVRLEKPVERHQLFHQHILPLWLGAENPFRKQLVPQLDAKLDAPLDIPIHIACVHGRKGRGPIDTRLKN